MKSKLEPGKHSHSTLSLVRPLPSLSFSLSPSLSLSLSLYHSIGRESEEMRDSEEIATLFLEKYGISKEVLLCLRQHRLRLPLLSLSRLTEMDVGVWGVEGIQNEKDYFYLSLSLSLAFFLCFGQRESCDGERQDGVRERVEVAT